MIKHIDQNLIYDKQNVSVAESILKWVLCVDCKIKRKFQAEEQEQTIAY